MSNPQIPKNTRTIDAVWGVGILVAFGLLIAFSSSI